MHKKKARKTKYIVFGLVLLGLLIFIYSKSPNEGPILKCIIFETTGLYCPGCGMTRAVNSLMHFKFKEAFNFNIFIYLLPIGLIIHLFINKYYKKTDLVIYILLFGAVLFGILRNIKVFSFLAPI